MVDPTTNPPAASKALPANVKEWMEKLTGQKKESDDVSKKIEEHASAQQMIQDQLNLEELKKDMSFEVTKIPDGAWEKMKDKLGALDKLKSVDPDRDPLKEIDTWHDLPGTQGLAAEEVTKILEAFKKVITLQEELEAKATYQLPNPKFDKEDPNNEEPETIPNDARIAEDLWMPLVREGIIPENAVPSKYSEVEKTFKGASEVYEARLEEYSKNITDPEKFLASMGPIVDVAKGLIKMGSASATLTANIKALEAGVGNAQKIAEGREALKVAKTLDLTLLCVTSTQDMGNKLIKEKDVYGAVDSFNAMLKGILSATIGSDAAGVISNLITCSSRSVKTLESVANGDLAGALNAIADGVSAGILSNNSDNKELAAAVKGGIGILAAAAKGADDPVAGLTLAMGRVGEAAKFAESQYCLGVIKKEKEAEILKENLPEKETQERIESMKANFSTTPKGIDDIVKGSAEVVKIQLSKKQLVELKSVEVDKGELEKQQEDFHKAQESELEEFLNQPDAAFEELLLNGFSDTSIDDLDDNDESEEAEERRREKELKDLNKQANSIETLIAVCKKDQMTFDLAKQIVNGAGAFVAQLLPAAGIVAVGTQLLFSLMEAVKHAEQLEIWAQNLSDAKKSGSVQADAMMNRFGLQKSQTIKADIIVALKAIDLVGQVVKTAGGPAAPAGVAISSGTKVIEGAMDVALTIKTEVEMRNAWVVYKKALKTPQDRKLARAAMKQNPTLSKYAMAYGACVDNNPVAIRAMKRCGLNEKTLKNEKTNVNNVVDFLETLYRDDPVLLKAVIVEKAWHAGNPELSVMSWQTFFLNATKGKKIQPKVKAVDVSRITSAIATYEKACKPFEKMLDGTYQAKHTDDPDPLEAVIVQSQILAVTLNRYSPVDNKDEKPHESMGKYVDALEALAIGVERDVIELRRDIAEAKEEHEKDVEIEKRKKESEESLAKKDGAKT